MLNGLYANNGEYHSSGALEERPARIRFAFVVAASVTNRSSALRTRYPYVARMIIPPAALGPSINHTRHPKPGSWLTGENRLRSCRSRPTTVSGNCIFRILGMGGTPMLLTWKRICASFFYRFCAAGRKGTC